MYFSECMSERLCEIDLSVAYGGGKRNISTPITVELVYKCPILDCYMESYCHHFLGLYVFLITNVISVHLSK